MKDLNFNIKLYAGSLNIFVSVILNINCLFFVIIKSSQF